MQTCAMGCVPEKHGRTGDGMAGREGEPMRWALVVGILIGWALNELKQEIHYRRERQRQWIDYWESQDNG